jgi:hypothetical protein
MGLTIDAARSRRTENGSTGGAGKNRGGIPNKRWALRLSKSTITMVESLSSSMAKREKVFIFLNACEHWR